MVQVNIWKLYQAEFWIFRQNTDSKQHLCLGEFKELMMILSDILKWSVYSGLLLMFWLELRKLTI